MKKQLRFLIAFLVTLSAVPAFAIDQVTLTNGQVVQGKVLNDVPNRYVDIRLVNGDTKRFERNQVASVDRDVPSREDKNMMANTSTGFISLVAGGSYGLDSTSGVDKTVLFDYGIKAGAVLGQMGDSKFALALSYDRKSRSIGSYSVSNNDLNLQFLLMRINNSGFYLGPNVGMGISSTDLPGYSGQTNFEAGFGVGYEIFMSDSFSIGPDVRYEHTFSTPGINVLNFALAANFHF